MSQYEEQQEYSEFLGVDLKSDNVNRPSELSPEGGRNILFGPRGEIHKLPGSHAHQTIGSTAQFMEYKGNSQLNVKTEEILYSSSINQLRKIYEGYLSMTYSGAGTASVEVGDNSGVNTITLYVNGSSVYTSSSTSSSLTTIASAISAVSGWSASFPGSGTATLGSLYRLQLTTLTTSQAYYVYGTSYVNVLDIDAGAYVPSAPSKTDQVPASYVNLNNVLYFTDTAGTIRKYDGHFAYRAGLPKPVITTTAAYLGIGGAFLNAGYVTIAARLRAIDYGGNYVYSNFNFSTVQITGGNNDVTIGTTIPSGAGLTGYALYLTPNALHTAQTTINVTTNPQTYFRVGDKIEVCTQGQILSGGNVSQFATITNTTSSSITVDTSITIRPAYNEYITHRVVVEVWRSSFSSSAINRSAGPLYLCQVMSYPLDGTPINSSLSSMSGSDAQMTAGAVALTNVRIWNNNSANTITEPPKGVGLTSFQGSLVYRDYAQKNLVHFSDQEGQEQFDLSSNNFMVAGDITGIGAAKEFLAVFKKNNTDLLVGDIKGYSVRVDRIDDLIGCTSHHTIKSIDDSSLYFLSELGPYRLTQGVIAPLGMISSKTGAKFSRIEPFFTKKRSVTGIASGAEQPYLAMSRASAGIWREKNLYLVYVPLESMQYYGYPYTFSDTTKQELTCWAYDYIRDIWLPPFNINPNAMANVWGRLFYVKNTSTTYAGTMYTLSNTGTKKDFWTQTGTGTSKYMFGWYSMGDPNNFKKYGRVRFFAHEQPIDTTSFTLDMVCYQDFSTSLATTSISSIPLTVGTERKVKLTTQKARSLLVSIENGTAEQDISINGVVVEWTPVYRRGMKE